MEENKLVNKLYINPLETITSNWGKSKGFRLKGELQDNQNINVALRTLPNLRSPTMGNVIIQNWETKRDIPPDIGELIHYPVLMDRTKYQQTSDNFAKTLPTLNKFQFSKEKIKKDGELLMKTLYSKENIKNKTQRNFQPKMNNINNDEIIMCSVFDEMNGEQVNEEDMTFRKNTQKYFKTENLIKKSNTISDMTTENFNFNKTTLPKKAKSKGKIKSRSKIIDFSTFNKYLYLRDNDFLYAKRVGGPVDFVLCTYQDINKFSKLRTNKNRSVGKGFGFGSKKKLPSLGKRRKDSEYITISKNTILHYQRGGAPCVYSIQEWVENYEKYKELMKIPLFKNFKNAKLFDLWRRFYKKTRRQYYTEKLKNKLFLVDKNLLEGIINTRTILKEMKSTNIFYLDANNGSVLLNHFNDLHKENLVRIDQKINEYRLRVKYIINESCNNSYQEYKSLKKITLDDNIVTDSKQKKKFPININNNIGDNNNNLNNNNKNLLLNKNNNTNNNESENQNINDKKKVGEASEIQNFIKDAIPYAQDATRKTHYKKLLKYIRTMDYIFNEAKFETIDNSLEVLEKRFSRLYTCYANHWVDSPIITTKILCMNGKIFYNPGIKAMSEAIFDNYIQETIYCVIYKKNFVDPQEFPRYMSCFEEVFEVNVDQNTNLNMRLKEQKCITDKFDALKKYFELCHKGIEKTVQELMPILENYKKFEKINFKELEENATPQYLKNLLDEFTEEEKRIKLLKPIINIGIFEFQLDDLIDLVSDAPKKYIERMKKLVPNIYLKKVKKSIQRMNNHLNDLSINPNDVESFIKLKKAVEACNKEKQLHEDTGNEIIDLQTILEAYKDIKIPEYDLKAVTQLKNVNVLYDRKLDSTSYFIDNNITNFRIDLKNIITKFDNYIKTLNTDLNNEILNTYSEDTYNALDYLEENSLKIKKCLDMKEKYQQQEKDLELDDTMKSNFENLENLVYNQDLKVNLWQSIKDYHEKSRQWESKKVINVNLSEMTELINKWLDLCKVAMVDLDLPQVPMEFKKRVERFEQILPVIETYQNENVTKVDLLMSLLTELLNSEHNKFDEHNFTCRKILDNPDILSKLPEIKELNIRGNEEKRLKDLIKAATENFYPRRIPITYTRDDYEREYEFVEENLRLLNRLYLNRYCGCILQNLERLVSDFNKYKKFLVNSTTLQKYIAKSEGILDNPEFIKDNPTEHKKLMNENLKKTLFNTTKDNRTVQRFFEHGYDKAIQIINTIILSYEQNYKAIFSFFNKKRKENPRYYLLSNDDLNEIYQEKDLNKTKEKMLFKIYPWIKKFNIGFEQIRFTTNDDEVIELKYIKTHALKDIIELLDSFLVKRLKENFKSFKKEYENAIKLKSNKTLKNFVHILIDNKEYLAQGAFNCMFFYIMDSIEKSLINPDEAFDKLFDLYNEIKDEKIPSFMNRLKEDKLNSLQKRIIINLISLENYAKDIIENLIREDITSTSDYNFCKLIIPKMENDSFMLHFISFVLEYGYDYCGFQTNFLMLPECEKMYIAFSNAIFYKKPMHIYGIQETGKKEILELFAKLCGKRINYINATSNYDVTSFNKVLFGNIRYGTWICIDKSQNIKYELLEVLAGRIMEIYRVIRGEIEEEEFGEIIDKTQNAFKHTNVFIYRDLSFSKPFDINEIPKIIKSYYRQVGIPKINMVMYLKETLNNLNIENASELTNKILYIIKNASLTLSAFKNKSIQYIFVINIISSIVNHIVQNAQENLDINMFIKDLIKSKFDRFLSEEEKENNRKFLNEVFEIKEYAEEVKPFKLEDSTVEEVIKKQLSELKINSPNYEKKLSIFYDSINYYNNFILVGPPMSGKSNLVGLINIVSKQLNIINKNKYPKFYNIRIYPKSRTPYEMFSENIVSKAYKDENNLFYDMLYLFNEENEELITRLNDYYNSLLIYKMPEVEEDLTIEKLNEIIKRTEEKENANDENSSVSYHREEEDNDKKGEKKKKIIIFDGSIDDTWTEYINNIYDKENYITLSNGYKLNFRDEIKLFFETTNLKNAPPSFLTNQMIVPCSLEHYSWDIILYTWIESNPKITENKTLKNYLRGLFENYFPRIYDFVEQNKIKNLNLNSNYCMQTLINVFDSIFPMFNFEDIKIGRKNFNVVPKIELIKKCTLSIFIFCCSWTMNLLSNFVIKNKIEKLISDLFKADDLKGPIFDYYIDEETNDFELWTNLLKNEIYSSSFGEKNKMFYYGKIFIHTIETIPYTWICEKLIDNDKSFYFNGREGSGKSFLISSLLGRKSDDEMEVKKLKMNASYYTKPIEIENCIYKSLIPIKRDLYGDKYIKQICLFIDDLNMNINKDKYGTSHVLEFVRQICCDKFLFDLKTNQNRYLKKFNIYGCGNISAYPYDEEFNRFICRFNLITYSTNDDYYQLIFKPSLELNLRQYIPNTSGVTSTQYIQVLLKLNTLLKTAIKRVPSKLHISFTIRDTINILQSFHLFAFKGSSDYPEYLKKSFFYESYLTYGNKLNKKEDIEIFKKTICEAYSSIFKQDKTKPEDIFNENWSNDQSFAFCQDYNNFNKDNVDLKEEHCYIDKKTILIDYIKSKIDHFYRSKDIRNRYYIKSINENLEIIIKLLRILENNSPNIILLGKESKTKRALMHFATYIANFEFLEVDSSYNNELLKNKDIFIESEIKPFLKKATLMEKKSILYIPPNIKTQYVFDVIHNLMDIKEIPDNFQFLEQNPDNEQTEEKIIELLEKNISICIDVNYGSEQYLNLFTKYPNITKNSFVIYIHRWNDEDMKAYYNISMKEIESTMDEKIKTKISKILIDIYKYSNKLYNNYYIKSGITLYLNITNFCNVCEFFSTKYKEYKTILEERQKKYNDGIEMESKVKTLLDKLDKEIKDSVPKQEEMKKKLEAKKEKKNNKTREKNVCRANKQTEDNKTKQLMDKKFQKETELDEKLSKPKEAISKAVHSIAKLSQNDITDIRNAWESFNFGKFLIFKVLELFDKQYPDWEATKRSLDIDLFKTLSNITPKNIKDNFRKKLSTITKDIVDNLEFNIGETKNMKPFKICGALCEYFSGWNKYFIQYENNKNLVDEINQIKNELNSHEKVKKKIIEEGKAIDDEINAIEQEIRELETRNDNMNHQKLKLNALNECFQQYFTLVQEKVNIWKNKKTTVDIILNNFDFYLMVVSCYLIYAAPLNKYYRKQLKSYLYSISKMLKLENIKELSICGIILEFLDGTGKDNEFCSSVSQYSEFLADNFTMMYIMNNKIPYLIDSRRISYQIMSKFLQLKSDKNIIKTNYNNINELGDMFEKIEISMKSGSILFIDQCEENIYDIFENLINERSGYNAKTQKRFYMIKNKQIDKHEDFKLYLINSKSSSKISPKAFRDCYVINFNCPSDVICGLITDKLCTEQDPETYLKINNNKKDININEFKLLELENKILNHNKQFDLTGNLDKLDFNKELLDAYKLEIEKYNNITTDLEKGKKTLAYDIADLFRYQCICTESTQIYKWCSRLFPLNNLYIFTVDYLSDLVKYFYKEKYGIYNELKETKKADNQNMNFDDAIIESKSESIKEEEKSEDSQEGSQQEKEKERNVIDLPTYTSDDSIEFVVFIYNKISQIYEPTKRKLLLVILLLNGLNNRDDNSNNFKQLLYAVYRTYTTYKEAKNDKDNENEYKSPLNNVSDKNWSILKQVNDSCQFVFSLFLEDIENHVKEWEVYLDDEDSMIESNFSILNKELDICFTPLTKFVLFSLLKPNLGYSLIDCTIKDILKNEEDFQAELKLNKKIENIANLKINRNNILEDLFKESFSVSRKPILMFEVENGDLCLEKELKDYYIKRMKIANENTNKQEGIINDIFSYKEINPSKLELTNVELEMIHSSMKNGGVIVIKNCLLIQDSLLKLYDEFQDTNITINENFKLILLVKNTNLLPAFMYSSNNIINNDFSMFKQMKEYLINLINETPIDYYNKFMNYEHHTTTMFHMKKVYIYFLIINSVLLQYSFIHSKIYKIPIDFCKKDFIISLKFLDQYMSSINEDKHKALLDPDNSLGFNFDCIIKMTMDTFVSARLIYREDEERVSRMLSQFLDGEQFLRDNYNYFSYDDFVIPKINEKLYPRKKETSVTPLHDEHSQTRLSNKNLPNIHNYYIPKSAVIELFEKIPNEQYYKLLYGVSNEMIQSHTSDIIRDLYNIFCKNSINDSFELKEMNDNENKYPEMFSIDSGIVSENLEKIKKSLPDQLNTADANPVLFKVNKFNELFNPLDECLQKEIDSFNNYINSLLVDINNVNLLLQGNMELNSKFYNILINLNKNLVPTEWKKKNFLYKDVTIEEWLNKINYIYKVINDWIINGTLSVYNLSIFYNANVFLITLPIYFQRKMQENEAVSSDKINLEYKLTKYEKIEEIDETVLENIHKQNGNKDFLLMKGFRLKNFESTYEKENKIFIENLDKKEGEELPIILVTYSIANLESDKIVQPKDEDDEEESDNDLKTSKNVKVSTSRRSISLLEKSTSQKELMTKKEYEEEERDEVHDNLSSFTKQKKSQYSRSRSVMYQDKEAKKESLSIVQKYKFVSLKKYCKLSVPIYEQCDISTFRLLEPLGYIDLRFKCTKDKQEEYFINSQLQIDIDN